MNLMSVDWGAFIVAGRVLNLVLGVVALGDIHSIHDRVFSDHIPATRKKQAQ